MQVRSYNLMHARKDLPRRKKTDNKTHGGKCLIIAGGPGQWGAAVLCARAAARSGAGYTFIYDFNQNFPTLRFPDFLISSKPKEFSQFNCIALGPGVRNVGFLKKSIQQLKRLNHPFVVLDAQALNVLAKQKKAFPLPHTWVMTPHEGEMSRLLQVSSYQIKRNRELSAWKLHQKWGCIVVLKGSSTLVASNGCLYRIKSGNSALAKAGTGDVLTGIITGLISQKMNPTKAACLGVYIHGRLADLWLEEKKDHLSLLATDLVEDLPKALASIRKS